MSEGEWLAPRFEQRRPHLRAVAYRMLGSAAEADDAVHEAWLPPWGRPLLGACQLASPGSATGPGSRTVACARAL